MTLIDLQMIEKLQTIGYSVEYIEQSLQKSPTLALLLNQFRGDFKPIEQGARSDGVNVYLSKGYDKLSTVAHELAHSSGSVYQAALKRTLDSYSNALDYANSRAMGEGEALYYEFKVAQELGEQKITRPFVWEHQQPVGLPKDVAPHIATIINTEYPLAQKITELGDINKDMIPSGMVSKAEEQTASANRVYRVPVPTYYEFNVLKFLGNKYPEDSYNQDYKATTGKDFTWNSYMAKTLAGRGQQHFGETGDDTLINQYVGGSVLGRLGDGDLLYGGAGNDTLVGNSGKDILLGGRDSDMLMGLAGDDTLGGNAGDDRLEGGEGNDVLVGSSGDDQLIGGPGNDLYYLTPGFGQDTLINTGGGTDRVVLHGFDQAQITQYVGRNQRDLVMQFDPNDRLTIKDYYAGGDNASMRFSVINDRTISQAAIFASYQHAAEHVPKPQSVLPARPNTASPDMVDTVLPNIATPNTAVLTQTANRETPLLSSADADPAMTSSRVTRADTGLDSPTGVDSPIGIDPQAPSSPTDPP